MYLKLCCNSNIKWVNKYDFTVVVSINWGKRAQNEIPSRPFSSWYSLCREENMQIKRLFWNVRSLNSNLILDRKLCTDGVHFMRSVFLRNHAIVMYGTHCFYLRSHFFRVEIVNPKSIYLSFALFHNAHTTIVRLYFCTNTQWFFSLFLWFPLLLPSLLIATCTNCQSQCNLILQS